MTNYLHNQIYSLMLVLCFFSSCNGQTKTQTDDLSATKTIAVAHPKMIRTQGTDYTQVGCGFQDNAGNLWFGTLNEGVYRYDGKSFTQFTKKDGLNDNAVNAIIEDKVGNILFGTNSGVSKYNGKSFTNFTDNKDINNKSIQCLLKDEEGNIWLGTMNSGVYRYNGKTFTNYLNQDDHTFNLGNHYQTIISMLQDKKGNIWFCSFNGGGVWQYDGKTFKNYLPSSNYYLGNEDGRSNTKKAPIAFDFPKNSLPNDSITDDMISSVYEDKTGNIWFGTRRHGACRYDGKTFTNFTANNGFYNSYSVLEDKNGNMWFTTEKNGVWCYNGKSYKNFTEKEGLVNNSVWFVIEDKNGSLWFGTRGFGLSRYDGKTFVTFSDYKE
jgi:ligand-binding sensor domain-containing protein